MFLFSTNGSSPRDRHARRHAPSSKAGADSASVMAAAGYGSVKSPDGLLVGAGQRPQAEPGRSGSHLQAFAHGDVLGHERENPGNQIGGVGISRRTDPQGELRGAGAQGDCVVRGEIMAGG